MSHRLVESYATDEGVIELSGRTYPVPCLVEDGDGFRWYVTPRSAEIPPRLWTKAAVAGAVGLLRPDGEGGWQAMTSERFMDNREEHAGEFVVGVGWKRFTNPPSYGMLVGTDDDSQIVLKVSEHRPGFVHLHTHTEYSGLDGRSRVPEIVREVVADGGIAVASTDHGNCAAHPVLQKECNKAGIKPIFGMEAYFVADRHRRPTKRWIKEFTDIVIPDAEAQAMTPKERQAQDIIQKSDASEVDDYQHLTLLAQTQQGLLNLWAMSTEAYREGFYRNPRMDWDTLQRHSEGVICATGCLRGPLAQPLLAEDDQMAAQNLGRLLDIFGDRLYIELHANSLPEQKAINEILVDMAQAYSVPTIAVVDSHYPTKDDYAQHQAWIAVATASDMDEEKDLFAKDIGLYVKTEAEVREALSYLEEKVVDEAILNTVLIAESCTAEIPIKKVMPVFSKVGGPEKDAERLLDLCLENWHLTTGPNKPSQDEYIARFEEEMGLLVPKGFCGYFLQVSDYVRAMKAQGVMVGPGRGSGGGSLVAYLSRITGIDPVEADLPFWRFMTKGRTALPDFDVDFPASKRHVIEGYITEKYGADHVIRIGTHIRAKSKGIIRDLARSMKASLPETAWKDFEAVGKIIDAAEASTAGLGLGWEELWAQEGELLQPYRDKYPELFDHADHLVGLLRALGKHPAGLVVSDDVLTDTLPLRNSEKDADADGETQMVSQFSMNDLEDMGYIKFDILTLRTLDTIQACVDLIKERRGIQINPDDWIEEYFDPQVWRMISEGRTLGIFQVETQLGTQYCKRVQPANMAEYADVLTIVRPGPRRSKLDVLYLDRKAGLHPVTVPDRRLESVLAPTYGAILYQEQVMATCMILAGYDDDKADGVRKILGKKKVDQAAAAGREFVDACVERGMERMAADALWEQMAEFAKYSFGKAHAYGYAVLSYWTAWLKEHYTVEAFTSLLSTVDDSRIPDFVSEARRIGFAISPPDINESGEGFSASGLGVRYGLNSLKGVGDAALDSILPGQPYKSFDDFRERSGLDAGKTRILARIGAFDSLGHNRRGLEERLAAEKDGTDTQCVFKVLDVGTGPSGCCTFNWAEEPLPVNERTGRTLKAKPIPKKCTKACRQYSAPPPRDFEDCEPYTEEEIRDIEMEVLGIHLSSTVFDRLLPEDRETLRTNAEQVVDGPEGKCDLGGIISKVRKHIDSSGRTMAFLGLVTEARDLDITVFGGDYPKYEADLQVGRFVLLTAYKNSRGLSVKHLLSMD